MSQNANRFNFSRFLILSLSSTALAFTASALSATQNAYATEEVSSPENTSTEPTTSEPPPPPTTDDLQASLDQSSADATSSSQTIDQASQDLSSAVAQQESEVPNPSEDLQSDIVEASSLIESAAADADQASQDLTVAQEAINDYDNAQLNTEAAQQAELEAEANLSVAEQTLADASVDVATQGVVVDEAHTNKLTAEQELAIAEDKSKAKVVESFKDENEQLTLSSTDIDITIDGSPVDYKGSSNNGVGTHYFDGSSLYLDGSAETEISVPNSKLTTEVGFDIYAKNGDLEATANLFDDSGATSTESFIVQNNVSSEYYPSYTHTEVYKSPSGFYISSVVLPKDYDIYMLDNIYYTQTGEEVDPALYQNVEDKTIIYDQEVDTLEYLQYLESTALVDRDVKDHELSLAQQETEEAIIVESLIAMVAEQSVATAEQSVQNLAQSASTASLKVQHVQEQVQSEVPPPPAPPVYVAPPAPVMPEVTPEPEPEPEEPEEEVLEPTPEEEEETPVDSEGDEEEQPQEEPEPEPEPEPTTPEPTPEPEPEPEPEPLPEEPESDESPEPVEEPVDDEPAPVVPDDSEPEPEPTPEAEQEELINNISQDNVIESVEELVQIENPRDITPEQQAVIKEAVTVIFQSSEPDSPEYEAALTALAVVAEADDPELNEQIAAIPVLGSVAAATLNTFNQIGNVGADINPEVREDAQKVVVASVIVTQVAQIATQAAAAAATAAATTTTTGGPGGAPGFGAYRRFKK